MTLSPASGSLVKNHTLALHVYENSGGDSVNAVQANLSYNTSQLRYVSFTDSTAFKVEAESPSSNSGSLHFARGTITPVTGSQEVVTVNFSVVAGSGTATVSFDSGSAVVRSTDNQGETLTTSDAKFSLTAPVANPTPPPSPSPQPVHHASSPAPVTFVPPSSATIKPNSSSSPKAASTLKISSVESTNDSSGNTVITWHTNEAATSTVLFGSDKTHLVTKSDGSLVTSHTVVLPSDELKSGTSYYFYVSSTDSSGLTVSSQFLPFISAGTAVSSNSSKLNKQAFTAAGIGAVIVAVVLVLFGFYRMQQNLQEQRELRKHFPDLSSGSNANSGGVVTFNPGAPTEDHQHPQQTPNQNDQANKIR